VRLKTSQVGGKTTGMLKSNVAPSTRLLKQKHSE
jgi:hypothetical protein